MMSAALILAALGMMLYTAGRPSVSPFTRMPPEQRCPAQALLEAERNGTLTAEQRLELERKRTELLRLLGQTVEI